MMVRDKFVGWALLLACGLVLGVPGAGYAQSASHAAKKGSAQRAAPPAAGAKPAIGLEPKAIEILKAASSRLAAARSMSFTAVVTYENPSRLGHPLAYTTKSDVMLQRPDKLRVITSGDGPASEFYYDGKTMVAYSPAENLAAFDAAPPTIDATLEAAFKSAAIYYPFSDLIVADPYKDIVEDGLKVAFYIGQSKVVGGTTTDMVAYITGGVFLQVWIGAEDKLPRMLTAVYLDDPLKLRHRLEMSNWQLDGEFPADTFALSSATNPKHIRFAHPNAKVPLDAKLPAKPTKIPK